ncbi:MAG: hypothetical protein VYE64_00300 [Planctomycetota bacterium]|nr:hypothetical protein [Planctomycetota bacterium]
MRNRFWYLVCCLVAGSAFLVCEASQVCGQDSKKVLNVFTGTKPLITLKLKDQRVEVDYSEDWQAYQEITNHVRSKVKNSGSSSSRGGGGWLTKMEGTAGLFAILYGTRSFPNMPLMLETEGGLGVLFQQNDAPHHEMRISAGPDHDTLNVQLFRPVDDFLFRFEQKADGTVHCKLVDGTEIISISGENYETLVRENWEVINSSIAPTLRQCGVAPPLNRYTKTVWTQFLAMMRPTDGEAQQNFEAVVEQLDSTRFTDREKATSELMERYPKWQSLIQKAAMDGRRSVECRSRLSKILDELSTEEQKQGQQVVSTVNLGDDVPYLIWLANRLETEPEWKSDQTHLFDRLEQLTGKAFGSELAGWNEYRDSLEAKPAPRKDTSVFTSNIDLLDVEGPVDSIQAEVSRLLPLGVKDGMLVLDRDRWFQFFGEKTPSQLMAELSALLEQNNLPADWLQPSKIYDRETVGYPQILFDSLRMKLSEEKQGGVNPQKRYVRISRKSLNRDFETNLAQAALRLHQPLPEKDRGLFVMNGRVVNGIAVADQKLPVEEFYFLTIQEKKGAQRKFSFQVYPGGDLSLTISVDQKAGSLVRYIQRANSDGSTRCVFQDLRGSDVFVASAPTFEELRSNQQEYYDQQWSKLIGSLGIQLSD